MGLKTFSSERFQSQSILVKNGSQMDAHKFEVIFREGRGGKEINRPSWTPPFPGLRRRHLLIDLSEGHQQTQPDAIPGQAGFRLFLKTGSYSRPDPKSLKFFGVNATAGLKAFGDI